MFQLENCTDKMEGDARQRTDSMDGDARQRTDNMNGDARQRIDNMDGDARQRTDNMNGDARQRTDNMNGDARQRTDNMDGDARQRIDNMDGDARQRTDSMNGDARQRIDNMDGDARQRTDNMDGDATQRTDDMNGDATQRIDNMDGYARQRTDNMNGEVRERTGMQKVDVDTEQDLGVTEKDVHLELLNNLDLLTCLPDVALVRIMSYLPLHDQYHMSVTCQRLNEIFCHPSLWHTIDICLFGSVTNYHSKHRSQRMIVPNKYLQMIRKFGKFFQDLTLSISGFVNGFPKEWVSILKELGEQCRLQNLTLEIGKVTSYFHVGGYEPSDEDIEAILSFVKNAFRLKSFHVNSWPMFPNSMNKENLNIMYVMMQNPKLKDLENLSLFWCKATEWSERMPVLPSREVTQSLVQHFQNLSKLSLRSPMFDQNVLEALTVPGRAKLRLLQIFIHFVPSDADFQIHDIRGKAWKNFVMANPAVEVEAVILCRTPNMELSALLKPECPLSAIKFMKYSRCDSEIITSVTDKYQKTLKCFSCYCESTCKDEEVISLVQKSKHLTKLIFHGPVNCVTVETLAQLRGTAWQEFEILEKSIHINEEEDIDDDRVIAEGVDGEYFLVSLRKFHAGNDSEDERKLHMKFKVSESLGYTWNPV